MEFDDQMRRYFGANDLAEISPATLEAGVDRMLIDLGMEKDRGRRFALWTLLHMLGAAPDLDVAFTDPRDRDSARDFMDMIGRAEE